MLKVVRGVTCQNTDSLLIWGMLSQSMQFKSSSPSGSMVSQLAICEQYSGWSYFDHFIVVNVKGVRLTYHIRVTVKPTLEIIRLQKYLKSY